MIRKAVYSFYSHPFRTRPDYAGFSTLEDFLNCWTLSVNLARRHFDALELVTDDYGRALLIDALRLPFSSTKVQLDAVVPEHIKDVYWTFGKLWAYALQDEPFIHVDYDVFLWKKPPDRILCAPMFGQSTESEVWKIDIYRQGFASMCAFLPRRPSDWYVVYPHIHRNDTAINVGIIGGNDIGFLERYASRAIEIVTSVENANGFEIIKRIDALAHGKISHGCNVVTEQYLYSSMCRGEDRWRDMEFLLDEAEIFSPNGPRDSASRACRELGYTHLITLRPKQNRHVMQRLKNRVQTDHQDFQRRIQEIVRAGFFQ